jgi:hypothetical protein
MKPRLKKTLVLLGFAVCLIAVLAVRSQPIVNWFMAQKLLSEGDANKRIVLINTSLAYDPQFWNPRYLRCALLAESDHERKFIADLILERFGTNAVVELRGLIENEKSPLARSNGLAVLPFLQAPVKAAP